VAADDPLVAVAPRDAIVPLSHGHPWVYADCRVDGRPGDVVQLVDDGRRPVAWGLVDVGAIRVRVLGRGEVPKAPLRHLVVDRVRRADAVRTRLLPPDTDAYRVVNAAGDGLPGLVVDRYADVAVIRLYSAAWERHLPAVVDAVKRLGWALTVYRRFGVERVDGLEGGETLDGLDVPDVLVVHEAGIRLLVRPERGQKTGLFLDQREHRGLVRRWAAGREVVNLFSYNGGFSVAAALGGAARVTSVDLAPDAIEDAKEVFRLNGLDPDAHAFVVADAFAWAPPGPVDLLISDPPSLSKAKGSDGSARRAYRGLHARLGRQVVRDGLLVTSSCTARLSLEAWREEVARGLADTGDWSWLHVSVEPPDHPVAVGHAEGHYLKLALLRRR
jgi:23S rRNA (cytosine1962-C5)-methyltransferase